MDHPDNGRKRQNEKQREDDRGEKDPERLWEEERQKQKKTETRLSRGTHVKGQDRFPGGTPEPCATTFWDRNKHQDDDESQLQKLQDGFIKDLRLREDDAAGSLVRFETLIAQVKSAFKKHLVDDANMERAAGSVVTSEHLRRALSNWPGLPDHHRYLSSSMVEHLLLLAINGADAYMPDAVALGAERHTATRSLRDGPDSRRIRDHRYLVLPFHSSAHQHWGSVVYDQHRRHGYIFDSWLFERETREVGVRASLSRLLETNGFPRPDGWTTIASPSQTLGWSCGVHSAEAVRAFLHEGGLVDWRQSALHSSEEQVSAPRLERRMIDNWLLWSIAIVEPAASGLTAPLADLDRFPTLSVSRREQRDLRARLREDDARPAPTIREAAVIDLDSSSSSSLSQSSRELANQKPVQPDRKQPTDVRLASLRSEMSLDTASAQPGRISIGSVSSEPTGNERGAGDAKAGAPSHVRIGSQATQMSVEALSDEISHISISSTSSAPRPGQSGQRPADNSEAPKQAPEPRVPPSHARQGVIQAPRQRPRDTASQPATQPQPSRRASQITNTPRPVSRPSAVTAPMPRAPGPQPPRRASAAPPALAPSTIQPLASGYYRVPITRPISGIQSPRPSQSDSAPSAHTSATAPGTGSATADQDLEREMAANGYFDQPSIQTVGGTTALRGTRLVHMVSRLEQYRGHRQLRESGSAWNRRRILQALIRHRGDRWAVEGEMDDDLLLEGEIE